MKTQIVRVKMIILIFIATMVVWVTAFTGCSSPDHGRAQMAQQTSPNQPRLVAKSQYFNQAISVEATIGPVNAPSMLGGSAGAPGEGGLPGGMPMGRGMGGMAGRGEGTGAGGRGGPSSGTGMTPSDMEGVRSPMRAGFPATTRQVLQVAFINQGKKTIELEILDVNSALGNFSPQPGHVALAPGQRAQLEPMRGTQQINFDSVDLTLRLRLGEAKETQVLHLNQEAAVVELP